MEKRTYTPPRITIEKFIPNEYVASCKDGGTSYKFVCNAGADSSWWVIEDTNGNGQLDGHWEGNILAGWTWVGDDKYRSMYHPCGATHDASTTDEFISGFIAHRKLIDGTVGQASPDQVKNVIIWTNNGTNTHCTTNLDISSWEKNLS